MPPLPRNVATMISHGAGLRINLNCAFMPLLGNASTSGTQRYIIYNVTRAITVDMANGMRHEMIWLRNVPSGTPIRLAKGMPAHIMATALVPLPLSAIFTATIAPVPKKAPWGRPCTKRAHSNKP